MFFYKKKSVVIEFKKVCFVVFKYMFSCTKNGYDSKNSTHD